LSPRRCGQSQHAHRFAERAPQLVKEFSAICWRSSRSIANDGAIEEGDAGASAATGNPQARREIFVIASESAQFQKRK
jgi:hypothetical protein